MKTNEAVEKFKCYEKLSKELIRYGTIMADNEYDIEGVQVRTTYITYDTYIYKVIKVNGVCINVEKIM